MNLKKTLALSLSIAVLGAISAQPVIADRNDMLRIRECGIYDAVCTSSVLIDQLAKEFDKEELLRLKDRMQRSCRNDDVRCPAGFVSRAISMLNQRPPVKNSLMCMKQSNARYYPTDRRTARVVGNTSWSAGHSTASSCNETLPRRGDILTCFKHGNGRYYPTEPSNGSVRGGNEWSAGHSTVSSCRETLPNGRKRLVCWKWNNGRYYPTLWRESKIFGSGTWDAGYSTHSACLKQVDVID